MLLYFFEVGFVDIVWIIGVVIVFFIFGFIIGYGEFFDISNDDKIVGINVWSVDSFVFVMQVVGNFGSEVVEYFVCGVYYKLFVFYFMWFGGKCFYVCVVLKNLGVDWRKVWILFEIYCQC